MARFIPLLIIGLVFVLFFVLGIHRYISFEQLKQHREALVAWSSAHALWSALGFMVLYTGAVAVSVPGATLLTLVGGFLFGTLLGSVYVVISATAGATVIFLATRYALADVLSQKVAPFVQKMEAGFQQNAFNYLLVLRLVPLFPFWLVNIVPGLLNMGLKPYCLATFLGIIPGTVVYVSIGNGLGAIFDQNISPNLGIIVQPAVLLPLLGLAFLSLLPVIYRKFKR